MQYYEIWGIPRWGCRHVCAVSGVTKVQADRILKGKSLAPWTDLEVIKSQEKPVVPKTPSQPKKQNVTRVRFGLPNIADCSLRGGHLMAS